jgi:hypothetical protein
MNRSISSCITPSLLLASLLLAGCTFGGGAKPTTVPTSAADQAANRAKLLGMARQIPPRLDAYDADASHLPGSTPFTDRITVETALDDLGAALTALAGDSADSIVRRQLAVIEQSRQQLVAMGAADSAEPPISAAVVAAYQSLDDISTNEFSAQANLQVPIAALRQNLDTLDTLQGDPRRQAVADDLRAIGSIMRLMDKDIESTLDTTMPSGTAAIPEAPATAPSMTP